MASAKQDEYQPSVVFPPGDTIAEALDALGLSQAELSDNMNRSPKFINQIIQGKARIHEDVALDFENVLGIPASLLLNLENAYRLYFARNEKKESLKGLQGWINEFQYKAMQRLGWLRKTDSPEDIALALLDFFGVASPEAFHKHWGGQKFVIAYKKTKAFKSNAYSLIAWLRKGHIQSTGKHHTEYDEKGFRADLPLLRELTTENDPRVFVPEMQARCAKHGVAVEFVPEIPGTCICGAAWWPGKYPLIQLSLRYKTNDHLWFSFFHEAKHILDHSKKEVYISEDGKHDDPKEIEADQFATNILIPQNQWRGFIAQGKPTLSSIVHFSERIKVSPAIVVGRLHHERILPFTVGQGLKIKLKWTAE